MSGRVPKILIAFVFLLIFGAVGYLGYQKFYITKVMAPSQPGVSTGVAVKIPEKILANKFGFLSGGPGEFEAIIERGAGWVRPHPGPFLWDAMQKSSGAAISFATADEAVKGYQQGELGILATLWPFADWDQKSRINSAKCRVSSSDEFLPRNDKKGRGDYLPEYRCNPSDWDSYLAWVAAVIERYDGDGENDMPGLKIPIKFWEVMNEPDLDGDDRLDFYKEDAAAYAELLKKTATAIREADPEAKILIAGAAGGDERFLGFYRPILKDPEVVAAFDIANVHCISNDAYQSFNVGPYQKFLTGLGISKPIWVTEAEAMLGSDPSINASQTFSSTKQALELGAERIFFTQYDFQPRGDKFPPNQPAVPVTLDGRNAEKAYQTITRL